MGLCQELKGGLINYLIGKRKSLIWGYMEEGK